MRIDLARRTVERAGLGLHLTPIEYRLLTHLAAQPDRVITHRQLLKAVWGPGHAEDTHYVRVHMANLRKKIEVDRDAPAIIRTVRRGLAGTLASQSSGGRCSTRKTVTR